MIFLREAEEYEDLRKERELEIQIEIENKLGGPIYGEKHRRLNELRDQSFKKFMHHIEKDRKESELAMRNLHQSIIEIIKFGMDDFLGEVKSPL